MKILTIHFKNINSLEGESLIDFEQSPFTDTGVFAITGPNGSGKSSILDVITLGLYGETFRFDRPAAHVMTRHTASCFAIIEFALGGEKYKSSWQVARMDDNPDSGLTPPVMQLIRLSDGAVLADTPQQVCTRITEITGMNFRNFTRSILLAQGDFAAFLNALDSERMDILEKIISTDIYAEYKNEIIEKVTGAQQKLDQLKQELAAITLMPAEAKEACEHDLIDFTEHLAELGEEQNSLKQQQAMQANISALKKQLASEEKNLAEAKAQLENTQNTLDQIAAAQDALLFKEDFDAQREKNHQIHQGKSTLDDLLQELKQLKSIPGSQRPAPDNLTQLSLAEQQQVLSEIQTAVSQLSQNKHAEMAHELALAAQMSEKQVVLDSLSQWLEDHAAAAVLLTDFPEIGLLKKLKAELVELTGKQTGFSKQSNKTLTSLKNNSADLAKEIKNQAVLKQQLEADSKELAAMVLAHSPEELDALRATQQERVNDAKALYNLAQRHQQLTGGSGFFSLFKRKDQPEPDIDALNFELETLRLEIKREENIKKVLDESIIREALFKKLGADRVHLQDGKPCPFCGALQHPYAKHPPALTNSKQALIDQKAKVRQLLEKAANFEQKISIGKQQVERGQAKQALLQNLRGQWLGLCSRLNTHDGSLEINKLGLMKELIDKESRELAEIVHFTAKYRSKQASIEKTKVLCAKSEAAIEQLQLAAQQLGNSTEGLSQEQEDLEAALEQCLEEERQLSQKVLEQLMLLGEKMPGKGQEEALINRLNKRREEYHGYAFRHKNLSEELAVLEAKLSVCQAEVTRYNSQLESLSDQLQTQESTSLHLALLEKQKLIAEKEQLLAQQEQDAGLLHQAILEKLQLSRFASLPEIGELLVQIGTQPELERKKAELEQEIDAKSISLEAMAEQLDAEAKDMATSLNSTELAEQLRRVTRKIEMASMEAQQRERLLLEQIQLLQRHDALTVELQQQEAQARPHFAEAALLAAENGMAFRRRVQGRLADKLLVQTNAILEKISGRYYLRQAASEQGLALEVEDTYQANARRLPKTLSGGESFVVSLALALGLAELANNGRSVDSLFLDEGFGNLDAESLYTVISTLENLHTHGKTVGVISHVEAVQKRFKAQLQVVKKQNGMGELRKAS
ncbi:MAG: AAA family ATPase [Methylococcales bacterium]|nr:AAA family ATPase [Methylococcales bacterium]